MNTDLIPVGRGSCATPLSCNALLLDLSTTGHSDFFNIHAHRHKSRANYAPPAPVLQRKAARTEGAALVNLFFGLGLVLIVDRDLGCVYVVDNKSRK